MARFELRFKPSVAKDLRRTPRDLYRIRQGVYRIVYSVDDAAIVIEVIKLGHRRDVYRAP